MTDAFADEQDGLDDAHEDGLEDVEDHLQDGIAGMGRIGLLGQLLRLFGLLQALRLTLDGRVVLWPAIALRPLLSGPAASIPFRNVLRCPACPDSLAASARPL